MGFLFYGHEVLQVECADSQVQSYPYKHIRDTYVTLGWISTDAFLAPHDNARYFNHINKIEVRHRVLRLNVKLREFLLLRLHNCTCDLSYVASISFANVNLRTYTHKNYATVDT